VRSKAALLLMVLLGVLAAGCATGQTDPATYVDDTGATLNAHGDAGGDPTTYWFEFGSGKDYGLRTPERALTADFSGPISERLPGLPKGLTYHYRACARNVDGSGELEALVVRRRDMATRLTRPCFAARAGQPLGDLAGRPQSDPPGRAAGTPEDVARRVERLGERLLGELRQPVRLVIEQDAERVAHDGQAAAGPSKSSHASSARSSSSASSS
jgi:hypothetical protein